MDQARGRFFGKPLLLVWMGDRNVLYVPDPDNPLTFIRPNGKTVVLDKAFISDGATVPRFFWFIRWMDPWSWLPGALVHDSLWELRRLGIVKSNFWETNIIMAECCRAVGVPKSHAWAIRWAVNLFGWVEWLRGEASMEDYQNLENMDLTEWMRK